MFFFFATGQMMMMMHNVLINEMRSSTRKFVSLMFWSYVPYKKERNTFSIRNTTFTIKNNAVLHEKNKNKNLYENE
jgi:hypothetical protein